MVGQDEEDYDRPPESSSEDEVEASDAVKLDKPTPTKPLPKRKREPAKPTRSSKRKKLEDKPDLEPELSASHASIPSSQYAELDMFSSLSQSQSKKRMGYGNRHKFKAGPDFPMLDLPHETQPAINTEDIEEREASSPMKAKDFSKDEDFGWKEAESEPKSHRLAALLAEREPEPASSAPTPGTGPRIFDDVLEPEESIKKPAPFSSPPTSPGVVDVDSEIRKPLRQEPKATIITCPVCRKGVDRATLPTSVKAPRLLSLRKQQDFCRQHRLIDAQSTWKARNYPDIDWQVLELIRIPKHIPRLKRVLQRKTKSYYLDQLEASITKAKGNRKVIRQYMTEGVLDIAKAGYYGPKGTKMIMNLVSSELSKDMSKMLNDKLVRATGIGNYVAAVLVPEVTLRLVMEDLGMMDEAEGRKVLNESTEAGLLLNPDDDHVDQDEID